MTDLRKAVSLLIILLCFGFNFLCYGSYQEIVRGTYDTLKLSEIQNMVSDTLLAKTLCVDAVDSFSATGFTRLKGITTFRGGPYRDRASFGQLEKRPDSMVVRWAIKPYYYLRRSTIPRFSSKCWPHWSMAIVCKSRLMRPFSGLFEARPHFYWLDGHASKASSCTDEERELAPFGRYTREIWLLPSTDTMTSA